MPWAALARVQSPGLSRCTAFLIGPHTAVTAAHCLYSRPLGRMVPAGAVHVLVGYGRGGFAVHRVAASVSVHPGFQPGASVPDVAVIRLTDAAVDPRHVLDTLVAPAPPGTPLMLGGYGQDRNEVLMADTACAMRGYVRVGADAVLVHDCAGPQGTSGAPILARGPDGTWQVAGVQATVRIGGRGGTGVPVAAVRSLMAGAGPP